MFWKRKSGELIDDFWFAFHMFPMCVRAHSESIPGDIDGGDSAKSTDASSTRATLIVETETCVAEDPSLDLAASVLPSEVTLEETSDTTPVPVTRAPTLALGDMVILGDGAPQEYRHHTAVVTGVAEAFCTVTVLDDTGGAGMGECWPNIEHLELLSDSWRIGRRVVFASACVGSELVCFSLSF